MTKAFIWVIDHLAIDADQARADQALAFATGTKALVEEDLIERVVSGGQAGSFGHDGVAERESSARVGKGVIVLP